MTELCQAPNTPKVLLREERGNSRILLDYQKLHPFTTKVISASASKRAMSSLKRPAVQDRQRHYSRMHATIVRISCGTAPMRGLAVACHRFPHRPLLFGGGSHKQTRRYAEAT